MKVGSRAHSAHRSALVDAVRGIPDYVDYLSGFGTQSGCLFSALVASVSRDCLCFGLFDFPLLVRTDESLNSVLAEAICIF